MTDQPDALRLLISATDNTAKSIIDVKARLLALQMQAGKTAHATEKLGHHEIWDKFREHTREAGEQFGKLGEHVKKVGENLSELIPALGGLGAAAGLAGLVELAHKAAEQFGELSHQGKALGLSPDELNTWRNVATLTDTDTESLTKSMGKLNRTLGEAAVGKNKDAAALFRKLHINPRSFKDSADALPVLAAAFERNKDATVRARMAQVLFGRAGMDMIPILSLGADKLREHIATVQGLEFHYGDSGEALEKYNESNKKLGISVGALTTEIGADLAPALQDAVDWLTGVVRANRAWIATSITGDVKELTGWLKQLPWKEIGKDTKKVVGDIGWFIDKTVGAKGAIEGLAGIMALKGVFFLGAEIYQVGAFIGGIGKLSASLIGTLVPAFARVEGAAAAAGAAESAAAAGAGGKFLGLAGAGLGATVGAGLAAAGSWIWAYQANKSAYDDYSRNIDTADQGLLRKRYAQLTPAKRAEFDAMRVHEGFAPFSEGPKNLYVHQFAGGGSALPPPAPSPTGVGSGTVDLRGKATVEINLTNAPPGTTVTTGATGALANPVVNMGQAWFDQYLKP